MFKKADCKMEARTGIAIVFLLVGCAQPQVSDETSEPIVAVSPTVAPRPAPQQRQVPRRLKLRLTLDRPEDLKVKVGDWVVKGQIISDRSSARTNLIRERESLRQQLKQLQSQTATTGYAVEQAEVEQARSAVEQAKDAIAHFHADSPWTDYARRVLPVAESTQLGNLEAQYQNAKGELAIAVAKLQKMQQQAVKRISAPEQAERLRKLQAVEEQLQTSGITRAPYNGSIKSIRWLEQTNQQLQVELTVITEK